MDLIITANKFVAVFSERQNICYRLSVHPLSGRTDHMGGSVKNFEVRIMKFSPSIVTIND